MKAKNGMLLKEVPNDGKKLVGVNGVEEANGLDPEQLEDSRTLVEVKPNLVKQLNG